MDYTLVPGTFYGRRADFDVKYIHVDGRRVGFIHVSDGFVFGYTTPAVSIGSCTLSSASGTESTIRKVIEMAPPPTLTAEAAAEAASKVWDGLYRVWREKDTDSGAPDLWGVRLHGPDGPQHLIRAGRASCRCCVDIGTDFR